MTAGWSFAMAPAGMTSVEYVRDMEEQITQLRIQVGVLESERDTASHALELEREERQRALELAASERKRWEEEHNNWRRDFEKQREQQVSTEVHDLLVGRVTKIELSMVTMPTTESVRSMIAANATDHVALDARVKTVEGAVRDRTSKTSGMSSVWFGAVGVVGLLGGLVALVAYVLSLLK